MKILIVFLPCLAVMAAIRNARGTTLVAPLVWALVACISTGVMATQLASLPRADWSKWMYIASLSTFCPSIALLGAKRPQNGAWQLIVLAFWFVISLPAIQSLLFQAGEALEVHVIWRWFVFILILVGCVNHLPTRFGWAALVIACAQIQLFWSYLPWTPSMPVMVGRQAGFALITLGIILAYLLGRIRKRQFSPFCGWSRLWLDFRDYFGVVWALRVMERVNSLPATLEAGVRLNWDGFYEVLPATGHNSCTAMAGDHALPTDQMPPQPDAVNFRPASPEVVAPLDVGLRNLLRRFVSTPWLDLRLSTYFPTEGSVNVAG